MLSGLVCTVGAASRVRDPAARGSESSSAVMESLCGIHGQLSPVVSPPVGSSLESFYQSRSQIGVCVIIVANVIVQRSSIRPS